jgi:hypothetical protein
MDVLFNPNQAWKTSVLTIGALLVGVVISWNRLATVVYQGANNSIAGERANNCRVLRQGEKLILGGYYFQPNGDGSGTWLTEGTILCDGFGSTAIVSRNGDAEFIKTGTAESINLTLKQRIADPSNPDSNPDYRVRIDSRRKPYVQSTDTNKGLF